MGCCIRWGNTLSPKQFVRSTRPIQALRHPNITPLTERTASSSVPNSLDPRISKSSTSNPPTLQHSGSCSLTTHASILPQTSSYSEHLTWPSFHHLQSPIPVYLLHILYSCHSQISRLFWTGLSRSIFRHAAKYVDRTVAVCLVLM